MIRVFHPANFSPIPGDSEFAGLNIPGSANEYPTLKDVPAALAAMNGTYVAFVEAADLELPTEPLAPAKPKVRRRSRKAA